MLVIFPVSHIFLSFVQGSLFGATLSGKFAKSMLISAVYAVSVKLRILYAITA